jgi:tetratricopeptide (TPR) repeat protein
MVIRYGIPPPEADPPHFKNQHVDICKKFFKKKSKGDKYIYVPQRFLNNACEFPVVKPPDKVRIFILGGSVVACWQAIHFEKTLEDLIPNKNFEVINCGMGGYDSYRVCLVGKEILSYQPDLIIVLSGNNEGNYNNVKINLWAYYVNKLFRKVWTYRRLQDWLVKWCEDRNLIYHRNKEKMLIDYEKHLRQLVRRAKAKDVPIILCTVPFKLGDCPPGGSFPNDKVFLRGYHLLNRGRYREAIKQFNTFLEDKLDNKFALYFLGCAYEELKDYAKAKENYVSSLELDYGNSRASLSSNKIVRHICMEEGLQLADLEKAFTDVALYGLTGREQFYDSCHWWENYYALVAHVIIRGMGQNCTKYSFVSGFNCYELVSYSPHFYFPSLTELGQNRMNIKPQIEWMVWKIIERERDVDRVVKSVIDDLKTCYLMDPCSLWEIQFLKKEIKRWLLTNSWVKQYLLQHQDSYERNWPWVLYHVGETYYQLGLYQEALNYFNEIIVLAEEEYLPYLGLALVYDALGERGKARQNITKASELTDSLEVKYYKQIMGL